MPRLRNKTTGVIVNVDADTADGLGTIEWEAATAEKRTAAARTTTTKSATK